MGLERVAGDHVREDDVVDAPGIGVLDTDIAGALGDQRLLELGPISVVLDVGDIVPVAAAVAGLHVALAREAVRFHIHEGELAEQHQAAVLFPRAGVQGDPAVDDDDVAVQLADVVLVRPFFRQPADERVLGSLIPDLVEGDDVVAAVDNQGGKLLRPVLDKVHRWVQSWKHEVLKVEGAEAKTLVRHRRAWRGNGADEVDGRNGRDNVELRSNLALDDVVGQELARGQVDDVAEVVLRRLDARAVEERALFQVFDL